jgi:hypothetical protein
MSKQTSSNKQGQVMVLGIMLCILAFLCAIIFIPSLKQSIDITRTSDELDCSNASIPIGQEATCVAIDWFLPAFIITVILVGLAYIGMKITQGVA